MMRQQRSRAICLALFAVLGLVCAAADAQSARAQELAALPPQIDETRKLVIARTFIVANNQEAGVLRLPDGSSIQTVWTAALLVNAPQMGGEPSWPRCEPAVYSLARVTPSGTIVWAKSYVYYRPEFQKLDSCVRDYHGYSVHSALGEVTSPGYYELPFNGQFYVGDPKDRANRLAVDASTGDVVQDRPEARLRVMDADALRQIKRGIAEDIDRRRGAAGVAGDKVRSQQLFARVEKALFPDVAIRVSGAGSSVRGK